MKYYSKSKQSGLTLIELLVVITIIGLISGIVLVALDESRERGRDGKRKTQIQEILKALELYYTDYGSYPPNGSVTGTYLTGIDVSFYGNDTYIKRLPDESSTEYYYCVSADGNSMMLAVNTEQDRGGSDFCNVARGPGPDYGCTFSGGSADIEADDPCGTRF